MNDLKAADTKIERRVEETGEQFARELKRERDAWAAAEKVGFQLIDFQSILMYLTRYVVLTGASRAVDGQRVARMPGSHAKGAGTGNSATD